MHDAVWLARRCHVALTAVARKLYAPRCVRVPGTRNQVPALGPVKAPANATQNPAGYANSSAGLGPAVRHHHHTTITTTTGHGLAHTMMLESV
jgi:hypothetical protein